MPLENEMKTPKDFRGMTGILNRAMSIIIALYIGLGLAGYLKYGSGVAGTGMGLFTTINSQNIKIYESLRTNMRLLFETSHPP